MNLKDFNLKGEPVEAIDIQSNGDCTFRKYSFKFVAGNVNGKPAMFAQVWLTDATFCTVEQGWFDEYAFKFKFKNWQDMPEALARAIHHAYLAQFNPQKKDFR